MTDVSGVRRTWKDSSASLLSYRLCICNHTWAVILEKTEFNSHTHIQLSHSLTRNSGEEIHIPKNIIPKSSFFKKKIVILNRKMII